jgi:Carboxypeptidase regulatory-like domain/TonB dependent receptor
MCKNRYLAIAIFPCLAIHVSGQTTTGLITGLVADSTGAVVPGAQVDVIDQGTGLLRTSLSGTNGIYLVLQLSPAVYRVSVRKQGFATQEQQNVRLEVNQSVTLDFTLGAASVAQNVIVTEAPSGLNTTSATLSTVIGHDDIVGLPLNGRQFTQLALLVPGASPQQESQQTNQTIAGLSPSVNGQRGYQNNFTMDGTLNNQVYSDVWAIAPPPDALQEFAVQSHITDAQFAVSSGANINLVTRSGTNAFHGAMWEFLRNDAFDAQTFPEIARLPYHQDQYGLYFGGPVLVPHVLNGKDNTWFSLYWEAYHSNQIGTTTATTLTPLMRSGNFAAELGTTIIGTDSLGRPEYANELYDPTTSRPDPKKPGEYLRDPYMYNGQLNVMSPGDINPVIPAILSVYYALPNIDVPEGTFPNYTYNNSTLINQDQFGIRADHEVTKNDSVFLRFNRNNAHRLISTANYSVEAQLSNYAQQAAFGFTHILNPKTILNFRYGYTYTNVFNGDVPTGAAFANSINFSEALPTHQPGNIALGPQLTISNGFIGTAQQAVPLGPIEGMDYHVDLIRTVGNHTFGSGVMYYRLRSSDDGFHVTPSFTQNATAQDGTAGPTGYGPASFLIGAPDSYSAFVGDTSADQTVNWYGLYAQDQWQASKRMVLTAGLRWDYVSPPNYHKVVSGLDVLTGVFVVTGPVSGYYTKATGTRGFFTPQYNGYEPRFGITYKATEHTVIHGAFAMLDDHNNTLIQENQAIRLSWPTGIAANLTSLDLGIPQIYMNDLPSAASLVNGLPPYASYGANTNNRIPYSMEYNLGVEQQLSNSMVLKLDYVGSVSRFQFITPLANTAPTPGPGPIVSRSPYGLQYGGPFSFSWNIAPASYNALQASLHKSLSSGLSFLASYTWSKAMDWASDPYTSTEEDFYDLSREWGPSTFSYTHMMVVSGLYSLPIGRDKAFVNNSNRFVQAIVGDWSFGGIFTALSGEPFDVLAGSDVANTGSGGSERANRIAGVSPYTPKALRTPSTWLKKAAFAVPAPYTFGNQSRDGLFGPASRVFDCALMKDFPLYESMRLQFRAESFNIFNMTNYALPDATVSDGTFGQINATTHSGRQVQFALKLVF